MDQGIAALIAGIAGMVGALGGAVAGGVAAVRGARIGAERTAQATRQQVHDQAVAEHGHWLREQRRDAYASFITAAQAVTEASKAVTTMQHEQLMDFNRSIQELIKVSSLITLMGPENMISAAGRVIGAAEYFRQAMWNESRVSDAGSQEGHDASDNTDEAADTFNEMQHRFVTAAQGVVSNLSQ
ncbi:hypothetical protein IGW14_10805 [Streptomyces hygroscopicus subsp. hygroscopicus]|uniref:hypothetical protein n=1 Tax=Streptomyces hygroscopicus TaxID=1912 RepID=UPI001C65B1A5|nr:hypothetical protein [Streptomyces hygroscopicus]MBW8088511.1 hypothetical protein [Streptomyces hygroscopicus subsp. hygroscopicus]